MFRWGSLASSCFPVPLITPLPSLRSARPRRMSSSSRRLRRPRSLHSAGNWPYLNQTCSEGSCRKIGSLPQSGPSQACFSTWMYAVCWPFRLSFIQGLCQIRQQQIYGFCLQQTCCQPLGIFNDRPMCQCFNSGLQHEANQTYALWR